MDETSDIDTDLGSRIKGLRSALTLSIEALAAQSGVSRAMISRIERGESSAHGTAPRPPRRRPRRQPVHLFAVPRAEASPLARRADPADMARSRFGLCAARRVAGHRDRHRRSRRGGTAAGRAHPLRASGAGRFDQLVWLREGELAMSIDGENWALAPGDCLHMRLDRPLMFHNPGSVPAKYAVGPHP